MIRQSVGCFSALFSFKYSAAYHSPCDQNIDIKAALFVFSVQKNLQVVFSGSFVSVKNPKARF